MNAISWPAGPQLLKRARALAAQRGASFSRMLAEWEGGLVGQDRAYRQAITRALARLEASLRLGGPELQIGERSMGALVFMGVVRGFLLEEPITGLLAAMRLSCQRRRRLGRRPSFGSAVTTPPEGKRRRTQASDQNRMLQQYHIILKLLPGTAVYLIREGFWAASCRQPPTALSFW